MKSSLSGLSALIAVATLLGALLLAVSNDSGGFLPNFGLLLASWAIGVGNILVFFLNLLRWRLHGAPLWLRCVVGMQALPALACLGMLGRGAYGAWRDSQANAQVTEILEAISADDLLRMARAKAACKLRCSARLSLNEQLSRAAQKGSYRVAVQLIGQSAHVSSDLGEPERDQHTCDGLYLPGLDALSIAVARNDLRMVRLLWPVSDAGSRRLALWTAAQTDRLAMLQWLVQAGVPLNIRGKILDENSTLLVAAASGGAAHVGQWLIESKDMSANALVNGPSPVWAIYGFVSEVEVTSEAGILLRLLVAHGAAIDAPNYRGEWPLEEAVRLQNKAVAKLFLDAGANPTLLNSTQRTAMEALLAQADEAPYERQRSEDCIDTHDSVPSGTSGSP